MNEKWQSTLGPGSTRPWSSRDRLNEALCKIDLFVLCEKIYNLRKQGDAYFSPVRDDGANPAFEIRGDGQVAIDHGTGRGFNVITLIAAVEGLNRGEAVKRLIYYAENSVVGDSKAPVIGRSGVRGVSETELCRHDWPFLNAGIPGDYQRFAQLRGLEVDTLFVARALDLLFFHQDRRTGKRLCTITDHARYVRQDRCSDGSDISFSNGGTSKSRTIGKASWPVGAANIGGRQSVLLVEGMPDLLAAIEVIHKSDKSLEVAPVTMLGAAQAIHSHALPLFAGKRVRIIPDEDEAGLRAARRWEQQLQTAGAAVDVCRLDQISRPVGTSIKDLNELLVKCRGHFNPTILIPTLSN